MTRPSQSTVDGRSTEFKEFLSKIYALSATLEGDYHSEYNPAGISQINPVATQGLIIDSSLQSL